MQVRPGLRLSLSLPISECIIPPGIFEASPDLAAALERLRKGVFGKAEAVEGGAEIESRTGKSHYE